MTKPHKENTMQLPMIHHNGSGRSNLIEPLCNASNALNDAYLALKETAPHGRDYYPLGEGAYRRAVEAHTSRLLRLDAIKEEIDALTLAIDQMT